MTSGRTRTRMMMLLLICRNQKIIGLRSGPADISYVGSGNIDDCDVQVECKWTNLRLRTWLGYVRCWASAAASVWTRSCAMPMGLEPSRSSDRTVLCVKQRAPLCATATELRHLCRQCRVILEKVHIYNFLITEKELQ